MVTTTRVTIFPAAIQSHFEAPAGAVSRDAESVGRESVSVAKARAPVRTGRLRESISFGRRPGKLSYTINVVASAPYAPYVLEGTTSPITPWSGRFLSVPAFKGAAKRVGLQYVRGQRANPFLSEAVSAILRDHGYPIVF